ncbi:LHFPL tetraspan subfamily member 6 protein isoform X1 [Buteo buteo]|uniref:LHFPL tetraspan subfamily member 6 protein isoform X1 n=1 Tax=Buteo buteo TaxID=30397 RepID=UPI003EC078DF
MLDQQLARRHRHTHRHTYHSRHTIRRSAHIFPCKGSLRPPSLLTLLPRRLFPPLLPLPPLRPRLHRPTHPAGSRRAAAGGRSGAEPGGAAALPGRARGAGTHRPGPGNRDPPPRAPGAGTHRPGPGRARGAGTQPPLRPLGAGTPAPPPAGPGRRPSAPVRRPPARPLAPGLLRGPATAPSAAGPARGGGGGGRGRRGGGVHCLPRNQTGRGERNVRRKGGKDGPGWGGSRSRSRPPRSARVAAAPGPRGESLGAAATRRPRAHVLPAAAAGSPRARRDRIFDFMMGGNIPLAVRIRASPSARICQG